MVRDVDPLGDRRHSKPPASMHRLQSNWRVYPRRGTIAPQITDESLTVARSAAARDAGRRRRHQQACRLEQILARRARAVVLWQHEGKLVVRTEVPIGSVFIFRY